MTTNVVTCHVCHGRGITGHMDVVDAMRYGSQATCVQCNGDGTVPVVERIARDNLSDWNIERDEMAKTKARTKLQTGLLRVQDMTPEEQALHFKSQFFKADCALRLVEEELEDHDTHAGLTQRVDAALDVIRKYAE